MPTPMEETDDFHGKIVASITVRFDPKSRVTDDEGRSVIDPTYRTEVANEIKSGNFTVEDLIVDYETLIHQLVWQLTVAWETENNQDTWAIFAQLSRNSTLTVDDDEE